MLLQVDLNDLASIFMMKYWYEGKLKCFDKVVQITFNSTYVSETAFSWGNQCDEDDA